MKRRTFLQFLGFSPVAVPAVAKTLPSNVVDSVMITPCPELPTLPVSYYPEPILADIRDEWLQDERLQDASVTLSSIAVWWPDK